jgi:hypothetical protein
MAFEYDIYLSYSEKDNKILPGYDSGWVDTFKKFLITLIGQLLQHEPKIITSHEVAGKDFNPLEQACVVIYLVSEEFVQSDQFFKETNALRLYLNESSSMRIDGKLRMFKVSKSNIQSENLPPILKELISYDLFMYDPFTGIMKEFDVFFGQDAEKTYWMRLIDLVYDMYKVIYYNQNQSLLDLKQKAIHTLPEECVYLAETGNDLLVQKNIIRRELERHGYRVLPDQYLSVFDPEITNHIIADLNRCKLSIHLVGENFADEEVSDKKEVQLMKLQNQLAAQHSMHVKKNDTFKRLLWLPEHIIFTNEAHQLLMHTLIQNADFIYGAEVLKNSIEEFKLQIKRELAAIKQKNVSAYVVSDSALTADAGKNIYLVVDAIDLNQSQAIVTYLKQNGFDVLLPLFEGDIMEVRAKHRSNLEVSNACVIFSDQVSDQWVKSNMLDIVKAPGFGKVKKDLLKAVYFSSENTIPQSYFDTFYFSVLETHAGTIPNANFNTFLNQIIAV